MNTSSCLSLKRHSLSILFVVWSAVQAAFGVSTNAAKPWLRHLIPLPKEISFQDFSKRSPVDVAVNLREGATDVEQQAAALLRTALGQTSGHVTVKPKFEILLGTCTQDGKLGNIKIPGADKLVEKPNSDQAYVITPVSSRKLVLYKAS